MKLPDHSGGDIEYNGDSHAECGECGHDATVRKFAPEVYATKNHLTT